mgnify:CR=1 FL=1
MMKKYKAKDYFDGNNVENTLLIDGHDVIELFDNALNDAIRVKKNIIDKINHLMSLYNNRENIFNDKKYKMVNNEVWQVYDNLENLNKNDETFVDDSTSSNKVEEIFEEEKDDLANFLTEDVKKSIISKIIEYIKKILFEIFSK